MTKGTVKYFNDNKGWGFITGDNCPSDVYVHYSDIKMDGFRTLKEGQEVLFELTAMNRGYRAANVEISD